MLSNNERLVIELIEDNPFLSQQEIASELNLNRSTVATIISTLIQKNVLLGKAYIINHPSNILCIGAMNIDRKLTITGEVVQGTSNPGSLIYSVGGVGRNISENLGRLGLDVSLLSLAGKDADFDVIKNHSEAFINFQYVETVNEERTGNYTAILDSHGEMQLAVADMSIYDGMTVEWISSYQSVLKEAEILIIDLNVPKEVVDYVVKFAERMQIPLFIIPVSGPKMVHMPENLKGVSWLIVNRDESEAYFNLPANTHTTRELAEMWIDVGVEQVIITSGMNASLYLNNQGYSFEKYPPKCSNVIDVTGAGDSFAAGVILGHLQGEDPEKCMELAMTNAFYTIQSPETVRPDLTEVKLYEQHKSLKEKGEIL